MKRNLKYSPLGESFAVSHLALGFATPGVAYLIL